MALIALQTLNSTGTWAVPSLVAAALSDTFAMPSGPGQTFAVYRNTNANSRTVTVDLPAGYTDAFGRSIADLTGAANLAATTGEIWIPLRPEMADSTGVITITMTGTGAPTNVTVAHVRIA